MLQQDYIKYLYEKEEVSINEISAIVGIDWRTAAKSKGSMKSLIFCCLSFFRYNRITSSARFLKICEGFPCTYYIIKQAKKLYITGILGTFLVVQDKMYPID